MNQSALKFQSIADFVNYTNNIDFGAYADTVIVANGEVTGTFKDATPAAAPRASTPLN
ncbi:hypothetical protein LPN04_29905 [Rugamonas sp. A1-17]|nr:hypothetical protein [Rugamonas sp. A1-17]